MNEMREDSDFMEDENHAESDSDDSELSEAEHEKHNSLERRVVELRKELAKTPYSYDLHVELTKSLRELGELNQLRHARESMSNLFPLSEQLWLEWIRDENKLATTENEKESIEKLFERAVQDYLSIELWLEYVQFSIGMMDSKDEGLAYVRSVMEKAVTSGGLHAAKGAILWDAYREFELAIYQTVKAAGGEKEAEQLSRVTHLFQRQLTVPLLDMENTWSEYGEWLSLHGQTTEQHVVNAYEKAKNLLEKITPFEEALLAADSNEAKLQTYLDYLKVEQEEIKDPARIQSLYERAVADLPLFDVLWSRYAKYVERTLKIEPMIFQVYNKAVRNCPWNSGLWISYLLAAEHYNKERSFVTGLVEKALGSGLSFAADYKALWLAFIDYLVRHCQWDNPKDVEELREAFSRACEHLTQSFGLEGDPECTLLQHWATIEARRLNNMEKARKLWADILSQGHKKSAQWWLTYINFERIYGNDVGQIRTLFGKALNAVPHTDWPESLVQQWIQFEREEGDLVSMETALIKCETKMEKVKEEREKQQTANQEKDKEKSKKRKLEGETTTKTEKKASAPKKIKTEEKPDDGTFARPMPPKAATTAEPPAVSQGKPTDPSRSSRTVFLSNLDFSVDEAKIRETLQTSGNITEIRLVRDYKQRSKGYCYVEFSTEEEARAALKRDREPLGSRPIFISPCETEPGLKHQAFKYQTQLEKNKLFVKGLATTLTKDDIEKLFAPYGKVKDVRIVTYRSGQSKGIAYVEYEDESSASIALVKTNGQLVEGKPISVAVSNPPPRRETQKAEDIHSLGSGPRTRKTQVSLIPTSVRKTGASSSTVDQPKTSMSNEAFREMLLKGKK